MEKAPQKRFGMKQSKSFRCKFASRSIYGLLGVYLVRSQHGSAALGQVLKNTGADAKQRLQDVLEKTMGRYSIMVKNHWKLSAKSTIAL